jgi:hypothetical protein
MKNMDVKALAILALVLLPSSHIGAQTSLSIYRDGRVVVRRSVAQALQQGRNTITLNLEGLDPATLFSPDSQVSLVQATARFPTTTDDALARAVGQQLAFAREKDTVRGTLVRWHPPQVRLADGRFLLELPGTPILPASVVRSQPDVQLVLDAARARPRTDIAFVGEGMSWEAIYQVVLGRSQASVSGSATVKSQSLRADSAEVQIVAGSIRRTRHAPDAGYGDAGLVRMEAMYSRQRAADSLVTTEDVGETHVYALPGRLTIEPNVPQTTALFPRATTAVTQELVVPGVLPWRGYYGGMPPEPQRQPVQVWYTLKRARGSPFGDRPLPAGTTQLYQADAQGRLQLVGEAAIPHTPAGKDLRVQSGDAFDVTAERTQTDYRQEQLAPERRGAPSRTRVTASFRVTLTNAKAEAVSVDVREAHFGQWRITESSVPAEKLSAQEYRFRVSVPAGGEATLTYTVQIDS